MTREKRVFGFTSQRRCSMCKKMFEIPLTVDSWGWNIGPKMFCSYGCMRAYERKKIERRKALLEKRNEAKKREAGV